MNDYDRLLESPVLTRLQVLSAREFEAAVKLLVERKFAIARQNGARKAPVTGEEIYPESQRAELEKRAVMALLARKWFAECEAPPWALALGGLPLSADEIITLRNGIHQGRPRPRMLADYGQHLRGRGWVLENAWPFERFAC